MSTLTTVLCGTLLGLTAVSCADKDFDWEAAKQQNPEYTFRSNFEKLVGKIDPNQSWDFSSSAKKSTRAGEDNPITLRDGWYYVENSTLIYYQDNLKEGDRGNKEKGKKFFISAPNNYLAIIPFYQGGASWLWDLHMVVLNEKDESKNKDINLWQKHKDIECQLSTEAISKDVSNNIADQNGKGENGLEYNKGVRDTISWYNTHETFTLEPGGWWQNYEYGWNCLGARAIRTKPIEIPLDDIDPGSTIYFYLDVYDNKEKYDAKTEGRKESSIGSYTPNSSDHMMIALPCDRPTNINQDYEVLMVGCEDNSSNSSDWDMNDLGFMIIADNINVVEDEEIITQKRYMIEDLGNLSETDVDFNDIVVDFQTYKKITYTFHSNNAPKIEKSTEKQRAIFRAMGGTLDFDFYLTGTNPYHVLRKSTGLTYNEMINTIGTIDYNREIKKVELTGNPWKPETNNVKVAVYGRTMTDAEIEQLQNEVERTIKSDTERDGSYVSYVTINNNVSVINFPDKGQTPFIIAFDPSKLWRQERQSIDADWLFGEGSGVDKIPYPEVQ